MSRKVYGGRSLLNLPGHHSTAAIVAEIDNTVNMPYDREDDGYALQPNITCKITDCENSVNIEFDVNTASQLENSLHKVDAMIEALTSMREGFVIEHHRLQDRLEMHPEPSRLYGFKKYIGKRSTILPEEGKA